MEKFYRFTYRAGKPVRDYGKVVLLDKYRKWDLVEGFEYIIEEPVERELEKCIIITDGNFLLVDDLPLTYHVSGSARLDMESETIKFHVEKKVVYVDTTLSSETDYENFVFGLTGNEEHYNLLPVEARQQVDAFRDWVVWIRQNQLIVLSASLDLEARRGFRLISDTESLRVDTQGSGSSAQPKVVSVARMQKLVYQPVFQKGFEPTEQAGGKEVSKHLGQLSLDESGLPFSFRPVWKSPEMMVGRLEVDGKTIEGLVKRPGDGTGSYLDAVMYLGLVQMPPENLSKEDQDWIDVGGRVCWVYEFTRENITAKLMDAERVVPKDPGEWVKVNAVYDNGNGAVRYIRDQFFHEDYMKLVLDAWFGGKLQVPDGMPWRGYGQKTALGLRLEGLLAELEKPSFAGGNLECMSEQVQAVVTKVGQITEELKREYQEAKAELDTFSERLEKLPDGIESSKGMGSLQLWLQQAKEHFQQCDFVEVTAICKKGSSQIRAAVDAAEQLVNQVQSLPEGLTDCFDSKAEAVKFWGNVLALPADQLDEHILINCGWKRVWHHLVGVSGDEFFFCGADPDDVVGEIHWHYFGNESPDSSDEIGTDDDPDGDSSGGGSNDAMMEALRKAGLVKE